MQTHCINTNGKMQSGNNIKSKFGMYLDGRFHQAIITKEKVIELAMSIRRTQRTYQSLEQHHARMAVAQ